MVHAPEQEPLMSWLYGASAEHILRLPSQSKNCKAALSNELFPLLRRRVIQKPCEQPKG